jgi:hypothetical protein
MRETTIERRQHPRLDAGGHPGRLGLSASVRVLDLSFAGALIETDAWLAPDREYPLRLEPGIQLTALVVRSSFARVESSPAGPRNVYRAGLIFAPPSEQVRQQLLLLLRSLKEVVPAAAAGGDPLPLELAVAV